MGMMRWFKMTCEDTSPTISESLDHPLPLGKRMRLSMHLMICKACQFYLNQLKTIQALACSLGKEDDLEQSDIKLSPESKEKMKQSLKTQ